MVKILLSSIAKNDIRLLMRVFQAEEQGRGQKFLADLKKVIAEISHHPDEKDNAYEEVNVIKMTTFPAHIHYTVDLPEDTLLITAVFKE